MFLDPYRFGRGGTVNLPDPIAYTSVQNGAAATASFTLGSNRQASGVGSGTGAFAWLSPDGTPGDFEVVVGAPSAGAFTGTNGAGTFNLGTTRTWQVTRPTIGTNLVTALYQIRRVSDPGTILDSGTLTLTATMQAAEGGGGAGGWGGGAGDGGQNEN